MGIMATYKEAAKRANCPKCDNRKECLYNESEKRKPWECGGFGLCPKLKDNTDPKSE